MKKHLPIVVQVQINGNYRVFVTRSFTIRTLIVSLQRYAGKYDIISVSYGNYYGPSEWSDKLDYIPTELEIDNTESKQELLENHDYRDALNLYYMQCAKNGIYPSKSPFRGIKTRLPEDAYVYGDIKHPLFIPDNQSPYHYESNILSFYEGRYISKMLNGEEVSGYLLTASRRITDENEE